MPFFEDIAVDYEPGSSQEVTMHDGSKLLLKKLEEDYDPTDKINAMKRLHETARRGEFATGLIYIEPDRDDFLTQLNVVDEGAPRRVRHRPDLHRAGPRRLPHPAQCGRRAAGDAPAEPDPPGSRGPGGDHGRPAGRLQIARGQIANLLTIVDVAGGLRGLTKIASSSRASASNSRWSTFRSFLTARRTSARTPTRPTLRPPFPTC